MHSESFQLEGSYEGLLNDSRKQIWMQKGSKKQIQKHEIFLPALEVKQQIQSYTQRMCLHQANICRLVSYELSHLTDAGDLVYNIYTDVTVPCTSFTKKNLICALQAVSILISKYKPFRLTQKMICENENHKLKVWISENPASCTKDFAAVSQQQTLFNLLSIFQNHNKGVARDLLGVQTFQRALEKCRNYQRNQLLSTQIWKKSITPQKESKARYQTQLINQSEDRYLSFGQKKNNTIKKICYNQNLGCKNDFQYKSDQQIVTKKIIKRPQDQIFQNKKTQHHFKVQSNQKNISNQQVKNNKTNYTTFESFGFISKKKQEQKSNKVFISTKSSLNKQQNIAGKQAIKAFFKTNEKNQRNKAYQNQIKNQQQKHFFLKIRNIQDSNYSKQESLNNVSTHSQNKKNNQQKPIQKKKNLSSNEFVIQKDVNTIQMNKCPMQKHCKSQLFTFICTIPGQTIEKKNNYHVSNKINLQKLSPFQNSTKKLKTGFSSQIKFISRYSFQDNQNQTKYISPKISRCQLINQNQKKKIQNSAKASKQSQSFFQKSYDENKKDRYLKGKKQNFFDIIPKKPNIQKKNHEIQNNSQTSKKTISNKQQLNGVRKISRVNLEIQNKLKSKQNLIQRIKVNKQSPAQKQKLLIKKNKMCQIKKQVQSLFQKQQNTNNCQLTQQTMVDSFKQLQAYQQQKLIYQKEQKNKVLYGNLMQQMTNILQNN